LLLLEFFEHLCLYRFRVVVFIGLLALGSRQSRGRVSCLTILVCLHGGYKTLPTTAWKIDHKGWHHKTRQLSTKLLVKSNDLLERCPEIFDTLHHITLVDVVRLDVDVCECLDEVQKRILVIVDSLEQD